MLAGGVALRPPVLLAAPPLFRRAAMAYGILILTAGGAVLIAAIGRSMPGRTWAAITGVLIAGGVCLHAAVPAVTPNPVIDVFTAFTDGAAAFLRGENPYETPVRDPYAKGAEQFGYELHNYMYPPANLPPHAASLAVAGDVRYAHVAGEAATAMLVAFVLRRKRPDLWHSPAALLAAGPLVFSRVPFLIEGSWNELLIVAALAGWWCCCHLGWMRAGSLLFGAFLSLKQYLIWWPLAFAADAIARRRPALILLPPLVVGLTVAPFLVWNAEAFWEHAVRFMAQRPFRQDSLSISAWLYHTRGIAMTGSLTCLLLGGAVAAWTSLRIYRRGPAAAPPEQVLLSAAAATMTMFVFGPQAFGNYYYLIAQVVLLAAVGLLVARPEGARG